MVKMHKPMEEAFQLFFDRIRHQVIATQTPEQWLREAFHAGWVDGYRQGVYDGTH